jgi:tight adherence protein C
MVALRIAAFIATLLLSIFALGQSNCNGDFKDISLGCIKGVSKPFVNNPIQLSKLPRDTILFYQTPSGEFGKLKITSVINNVSKSTPECTVFLDAVTYGANSSYVPNSSLSISPEKNHWLSDRIFLDKEGYSALLLEKVSEEELESEKLKRGEKVDKKDYTSEEETKRTEASCVLLPSPGTKYFEFRKGSNEEKEFQQNSPALFYAPLVLIFVAIFLIVRVFIEDQDKYKTQEALEEAEASAKPKNQALFLKVTRPFYKRYFLPIVQSSKHRQNFKNKYKQKLANAGLVKEMTPEEFVALKFFMIIGGPFAYLLVRYITEAEWPLAITPVMGIIGFFYPDIWISGMIKKRADETLRAMPFIVDMLALSVEAGLDFMAAIQRVIEKAPPSPLVEEFETLIKETKIGSSRAEGLRQLGWRVNIIEINSFCATLIAADSVGASIGPLLKQLSNELRVKRSSRAEQLGATAATKILIPMIFFILPAVLVAIFAPMVLKFISGKL